MQLPEIIQNDSKELKDVILVLSDDLLAEFITYDIESNTIKYTPNNTTDS